jgi:hypothetical protein
MNTKHPGAAFRVAHFRPTISATKSPVQPPGGGIRQPRARQPWVGLPEKIKSPNGARFAYHRDGFATIGIPPLPGRPSGPSFLKSPQEFVAADLEGRPTTSKPCAAPSRVNHSGGRSVPIGWPRRPEGRLGREATRSSIIRDHLQRDGSIAAICDTKELARICIRMARLLVAARPGRTNLQVGARAHGRATRILTFHAQLPDGPAAGPAGFTGAVGGVTVMPPLLEAAPPVPLDVPLGVPPDVLPVRGRPAAPKRLARKPPPAVSSPVQVSGSRFRSTPTSPC